MTNFQVIDSHIHLQPWKMLKPHALELLRGNRPDAGEIAGFMESPDLFLRYLDRERIEKVVSINYVSPDIMGFTEEVNAYAVDYAGRTDGRVIAFGSVHPLLARDAAREMDSLIASGIRGVKMHPSHQSCFPNAYRTGNRNLERIYSKAQEAGLVVMFHTGTSIFPGARNVYADPIFVDDVAVDFPRLTIILAHGGRPLWMETCHFLIRRFQNVYMDVSSIPPSRLLDYFPRLEEVADNVLWGSDWPAPGVPGMRINVDTFLTLPLSDEAKCKILYENARRIYA